MGKTPKPLRILVHPSIADWPEWEEMRAQGHTITTLESEGSERTLSRWDLILGPTCWMMDPAHRPYVKLAIQAARKARYPGRKEEE